MNIHELLQQLDALRQEIVSSILNDEKTSILKKLSLIKDNELWGYCGWISHVFSKQEKEFDSLIKASGEKYSIIDDYINRADYRGRGSTVDLVDELEYVAEIEDDEIVVLTNRGTNHEFKMKKKDVEQTIYNWCCENKKLGYKFDW